MRELKAPRAIECALVGVLVLAGCVHPAPPPAAVAQKSPRVVVDSPRPGALIGTPEVDIEGRVETYDGRAWVHAEATAAEITGSRFIARHVPLREGDMVIKVAVADGRGGRAEIAVPVVVENPDRPRAGKLCKESFGCIAYEERGVPIRDAEGRVTNAVVVIAPFGFDERLDELWPDLVGPGRALDPRRQLVIGVAGVERPPLRPLPDADLFLELFDRLFDERKLSRDAALVGAPSYGAELALRALARGLTRGSILICGGHDRPFDEPAMQATFSVAGRKIIPALPTREYWVAEWVKVARVIVPASYGPGFLDDPKHAGVLGIDPARFKADALGEAAAQLGGHFAETLPLRELDRRMRAAFELRDHPLVYPDLRDRRVIIVANAQDQMMSLSRERALALRLRLAGATVTLHAFSDALGHSVFFHRAPLELELALRELTQPRPSP